MKKIILLYFKLISLFEYSQVFTIIIFYMVVYNLALALFFITLNQLANNSFTTTFSLYNIPQGTYLSKNLMISLFSMAGVPPFIGFFSKVSIFVILANSFLFLLFPIFFILLFSGLYFYIQNIRLILTSHNRLLQGKLYNYDLALRHPYLVNFVSYLICFVLLFSLFILEDTLLYSVWLLS